MPGSETLTVTFCYVYVLRSLTNGMLYHGLTTDLKMRCKGHNQGLVRSTKSYRPWQLIYCEAGLSSSDAERRERYFKTNQGRRLLKRRLKDYLFTTKF